MNMARVLLALPLALGMDIPSLPGRRREKNKAPAHIQEQAQQKAAEKRERKNAKRLSKKAWE